MSHLLVLLRLQRPSALRGALERGPTIADAIGRPGFQPVFWTNHWRRPDPSRLSHAVSLTIGMFVPDTCNKTAKLPNSNWFHSSKAIFQGPTQIILTWQQETPIQPRRHHARLSGPPKSHPIGQSLSPVAAEERNDRRTKNPALMPHWDPRRPWGRKHPLPSPWRCWDLNDTVANMASHLHKPSWVQDRFGRLLAAKSVYRNTFRSFLQSVLRNLNHVGECCPDWKNRACWVFYVRVPHGTKTYPSKVAHSTVGARNMYINIYSLAK